MFLAALNGAGKDGDLLCKSDGTAEGTVVVKNFNFPSSGNPVWDTALLYNLTNVNGTLFFSAYDEEHGEELWAYYPNIGDIKNDGKVDFKDYALLALRWLEEVEQ